jgi:hypothetical protein
MDQEFFDSFYKDQYERLAAYFNRRSRIFRHLTRLQQVSLLVCSAITPAIIALTGADTNGLKILAVGLSSLVAVLSGMGRIIRPEDAWMNARVTRDALHREAAYYHAGLSDYGSCGDKRLLFVERVMAVLDRYNLSQMTRLQESIKEPVAARRASPDSHGN